MDAGSSHTAMFIYKWPADKQNGTGIVSQHRECHAKGEYLMINVLWCSSFESLLDKNVC